MNYNTFSTFPKREIDMSRNVVFRRW